MEPQTNLEYFAAKAKDNGYYIHETFKHLQTQDYVAVIFKQRGKHSYMFCSGTLEVFNGPLAAPATAIADFLFDNHPARAMSLDRKNYFLTCMGFM